MKTRLVKNAKPTEYPCLQRNSTGTVVLLREYGCGTVVHEDNAHFGVGHHSNSWNMKQLEPFTGVVELED